MALEESDLNARYGAIIIGGGLSGCVLARRLADEQGCKVLLVERRNHVGGNLYDYFDENKILIQKYGPHVFHTDDDELFDFFSEYCECKEYHLKCMVHMCGKNTPSPFNYKTIDDYFDEKESAIIKSEIQKEFGTRKYATIVELLSSENPVVKKYADFLFKHDYSLYTAKQWGISPSEIDLSVLKRVPVLFSYDDEYFFDKYQVLPVGGFSSFIKRVINHTKIEVILSSDFTDGLAIDTKNNIVTYDGKKISIPIVYTGELDRLLNYRYGQLPYRSLMFKNVTLQENIHQPAPVIAYPEDERITRIVEYKQLPIQNVLGVTTLVEEYPVKYEGNNEPYYPILTNSSNTQYKLYNAEIENITNLYVCGRLGDFKYYNMDQAIRRAFDVFNTIKRDAGM